MQGQRAWAEIDLDRLRGNVALLRRRLSPGAKLMAVVKSDAYGHGALPAARAALAAGAARLAVAGLAEGLELRAGGVTAPVLVLGWTPPEEAAAVVRADLEQAVLTPEDARAFAAAGVRAQRPARLHAKVDTGMGRLGWPVRDAAGQAAAAAEIAALARLPGAELAGVFTHFAGADEADLCSARRQLAAFRAVLAALEAAGVQPGLRHCANTAALLRLPEAHFDACRAGIGLYGYLPSAHVPDPGLLPVMTWRTRVAQVKELQPGDTVSYNATYVADRRERVATLPVGYGDGLLRALSGCGEVLVNGRPAPMRGRVCMNLVVVGVAECGPVGPGDPAVLLGEQGASAQWADALAARAGTISYEILCAAGRGVPRVYRGA